MRIIPSRVNYAFVDFENAADAKEAIARFPSLLSFPLIKLFQSNSKDKIEFFGKTIRLEIAKKDRGGGRRRDR